MSKTVQEINILVTIIGQTVKAWKDSDVEELKAFQEYLKMLNTIPISSLGGEFAKTKIMNFFNASPANKDLLITFLSVVSYKAVETGIEWDGVLDIINNVLNIKDEVEGKTTKEPRRSSLILISSVLILNPGMTDIASIPSEVSS